MEIENNRLYTLAEIMKAGYLGMSRQSLVRLIKEGRIRAIDNGVSPIKKHFSVQGNELVRFLESRKVN